MPNETIATTTAETATGTAPESRDQRLQRLQKEKHARDKLAAERDQDAELAELDADAKFSAEGLIRGHDFEIVRVQATSDIIVVKRGAGLLFERFSHSPVTTQKTVLEYVVPCVAFPEISKAKAMFDDFPGLVNRCAIALSALYGADTKAKTGKY